MAGVPIATDEYVLERAMQVAKHEGVDILAHCLTNMPDKKTAALVASKSLRQRKSYLDWALDMGLSLEARRRVDNWA